MSRAEKVRRRERRRQRHDRSSDQRLKRSLQRRLVERGVQLVSYDITYEPVHLPEEVDPGLGSLDERERDELYEQVYTDPRAVIEKLEALLKAFPDSRTLSNWLAMAYQGANDFANVERVTRELYARHPDYLFARTAMAQLLLKNGELDQIPKLFDEKFDLKMMYPHRNVFHITEVLAFCDLMVEFLMRTNRRRQAEVYFEIMDEMAPDHPLTKRAREVIMGSQLLQLIRNMSRRLRG